MYESKIAKMKSIILIKRNRFIKWWLECEELTPLQREKIKRDEYMNKFIRNNVVHLPLELIKNYKSIREDHLESRGWLWSAVFLLSISNTMNLNLYRRTKC